MPISCQPHVNLLQNSCSRRGSRAIDRAGSRGEEGGRAQQGGGAGRQGVGGVGDGMGLDQGAGPGGRLVGFNLLVMRNYNF